VHGNGEDWDPMGPMGFHGNGSKISHGMGMGIKCMGIGVKTWELSPATVNSFLFLHGHGNVFRCLLKVSSVTSLERSATGKLFHVTTWSKGSNAGGATA